MEIASATLLNLFWIFYTLPFWSCTTPVYCFRYFLWDLWMLCNHIIIHKNHCNMEILSIGCKIITYISHSGNIIMWSPECIFSLNISLVYETSDCPSIFFSSSKWRFFVQLRGASTHNWKIKIYFCVYKIYIFFSFTLVGDSLQESTPYILPTSTVWTQKYKKVWCIYHLHHDNCILEVNSMKAFSVQGIVRPPIGWLKPNSSSARFSKSWNEGSFRYDIGTTYLFLWNSPPT